jgi:hypothetical protein
VERLVQDIKDMCTKEYPPNVLKYKEAVRRIRICTKQETDEVEVLLNPVIACLTSDYYLKSYQTIDFTQKKINSRAKQSDRTLAAKQIFYMRECPEFLSRHDYKRQKEIATSLFQIMLKNAQTIFNQHLPVIIGDEGQSNIFLYLLTCFCLDDDEKNEMKNARIEALSLHIKLLSHFALTPSVRKNFLATPIIDQMFLILENETLIDSNGRVTNTQIGIVREALTLLYNLAFEKEIIVIMKTKNLLSICTRFYLEKDEIVQFTSQTLTVMLESQMVDELVDPHALSKTYIEYMNKSSKEPRRPYQGVKLRGILQNLESKMKEKFFCKSKILF